MIKATIYDSKTGQIELSIEAPDKETVLLQGTAPPRAVYWEDALDWHTHYFVKGAPVSRPKMVLYVTPGTELKVAEQLLVRNIPKGCKVTHPAGTTLVEDGFISWSTITPGTYEFKFKCFPYQDEVFNASVG